MHGAAFFASGQGGAEENFIGWGKAQHGVKSLWRGKGNYSQTRGIFRAERGSLETFWGQGGPGQPFFQRPGGGGACIPVSSEFTYCLIRSSDQLIKKYFISNQVL